MSHEHPENEIGGLPATHPRAWSYYAWADPAGVVRAQGSTLSGQNGVNLLSLAYSYDALGDITSIQQGVTPNIQTQSFTYDALQRLTSAQAVGGAGAYPLESYTYDDAGRLTQKDGETLTYAAGKHAALSKGSSTYTYDLDGSLTQRVTAQGTFTYTYDVEGRLREARLNGALQATYLYDGDGGLTQKLVGDTTTLYIGNLVEIELGPGAAFPDPLPCWPNCIDPPPDPTEIYMAPMMPGAPLPVWRYYYFFGSDRVGVRDNGDLSYLFGDHLDSTTVTANPNGTLQSETRYKPWGEMRYSSGTVPTDFLYTSQRDAPETGLYYYNARWYDNTLGRFAQADTIVPEMGSPIGWDAYAYSRNNPINYNDPSGHAYKLDDDGNSHDCPANTCYGEFVGSTPGLPYYPTSPTLAQFAENTGCASCSAEGWEDATGIANMWDGLGVASDFAVLLRNAMVEIEPTKINMYAFYKVINGGHSFSIISLDVQNPTGVDVSVTGVRFSSSQGALRTRPSIGLVSQYRALPGDSIRHDDEGIYGFSPVAQAKSTTTIHLIPSGFSGNPGNSFPRDTSVMMTILSRQTQTGMLYKSVSGIIN